MPVVRRFLVGTHCHPLLAGLALWMCMGMGMVRATGNEDPSRLVIYMGAIAAVITSRFRRRASRENSRQTTSVTRRSRPAAVTANRVDAGPAIPIAYS